MTPWTPTPHLRFIMRHGQRILQQLWEHADTGATKWNDVELWQEGGTE